MLEKLGKQDFDRWLDQTFRFHVGETVLECRLVEVSALGSPTDRRHGREPCSVVFRGPEKPLLEQGIYPVHNDAMGRLEMFVVPIGPDEDGFCYEAVFN